MPLSRNDKKLVSIIKELRSTKSTNNETTNQILDYAEYLMNQNEDFNTDVSIMGNVVTNKIKFYTAVEINKKKLILSEQERTNSNDILVHLPPNVEWVKISDTEIRIDVKKAEIVADSSFEVYDSSNSDKSLENSSSTQSNMTTSNTANSANVSSPSHYFLHPSDTTESTQNPDSTQNDSIQTMDSTLDSEKDPEYHPEDNSLDSDLDITFNGHLL